MDPLVIALVGGGGVVVGGLVSGLFVLLVGILDNKRQHERWQRENRLTAYVDYLQRVDHQVFETNTGVPAPRGTGAIVKILSPLVDIISRLSLLGPESAVDAARALRDEVALSINLKKESPGFLAARANYIVTTRTALGITTEE